MSPKDMDFGLVSEKNLGQKNRPIWWGQVKVAKKMQKHPHLWRSPQQMPNQKQTFFFRCQLEDLLNL